MAENETSKNLMEDVLEEMKGPNKQPKLGEIVTGKVIEISGKEMVVDIGCKSDCVIPKNEINFTSEDGEDRFKVGDEISGKVIKIDDGEGNILLSHKKAQIGTGYEDIRKAYEERSPIEVKVMKIVNGGVIAAHNEVAGFIPLSQLSDKFVESAEEYYGKIFPVYVIKFDMKKNRIIFSYKEYLIAEKNKIFDKILEELAIGDIVEGRIMRFTPYGAFVDIGGIDGLLHISEMAYGKINHPNNLFSLGDKINVAVINIDKEAGKIALGYKQMQPEPWIAFSEKYKPGDIIKGKAVQLKEYGVFVEIESGLDGLVHISEISNKRIEHVSDVIKLGQEITAKILEFDEGKKRISLTMKELLPKDEDLGEFNTKTTKKPDNPNYDAEKEMPDPAAINVEIPYKEGIDSEKKMPDPDKEEIDYQDPSKDPEMEMPKVKK
ncbi:MAG: S1 RNA-binding domain-containing protein [Clostridiales Family XIII bacterium]|jgi:4-hydroxy-3-methylbut-2-enyl diphosphate reductase|nr:S1 RNA-binding domain-containing protein [Clostridiales Family XIII bacterium]